MIELWYDGTCIGVYPIDLAILIKKRNQDVVGFMMNSFFGNVQEWLLDQIAFGSNNPSTLDDVYYDWLQYMDTFICAFGEYQWSDHYHLDAAN